MSKLTTQSYYEISALWGRDNIELSQAHTLKVINNIINFQKITTPILDAGCGDGLISNALKKKYPDLNIIGIDSSYNAISHLSQKEILGVCSDISSLPFPDNIFHLTWCMDVFEHLPLQILKHALLELKRVTKKYVLIVTPSSESDCIIVSCPNCVTIFNPYHHISYFNIEQWSILQEITTNVTFIPIGGLKPNLPIRGLRQHTVSDELYASVKCTKCPLCQEIFSVQAKNDIDMNGVIADFVAKNKPFFGNRFEELGILLELPTNQIMSLSTYNFQSNKIQVKLYITPINQINFRDATYAKNKVALFNQGGFYLITEAMNVVLNEKCYFVQHSGTENRAVIVLHPSSAQNHMNLTLKFKDNSVGILHLSLFERTTNSYKKIQDILCIGNELEKEEKIFFDPLENQITPYGILLEITCTSEDDNFSLELLELLDNNFHEECYLLNMDNGTIVINELNNIENMQLRLQFLKNKPRKVQLLYKNIRYVLSHLLSDVDDDLILKLPKTLFTDVNEV